MGNTNLKTITAGANLAKKIFAEVIKYKNPYAEISFKDVQDYVRAKGGSFDAETRNGLESMLKYSLAAFGGSGFNNGYKYVDEDMFSNALNEARRNIKIAAEANGSKKILSAVEQSRLATTWNALVEFSKINKGCTVDEAFYI